jgi:predicted regulator of Ras-like GTPase activity (Roadblock/LC7/MglB family)
MKQKKCTETSTELIDSAAVISVGDDKDVFADLSTILAEIRKLKGVIGYILRSESSAIVDVTEQDKIIDYALLSSQIYESSFEMTKQFNISNIESVLVEGKSVKVLCMSVGENKIGVFMEKTAAHAWITKRVLL